MALETDINLGVPARGPQGERGPAGERGSQGLVGPKGDPGVAGPRGETGATYQPYIASDGNWHVKLVNA